jgi:hypothetical protein
MKPLRSIYSGAIGKMIIGGFGGGDRNLRFEMGGLGLGRGGGKRED